MTRSGVTLMILMVGVLTTSACAQERTTAAPKEFELGALRVQVTVPPGWEAVDQGRKKRFRNGESGIVLENLGPAKPPARDPDAFVDWGLAEVDAQVGHDRRRQVKSRRTSTIDGYDAIDIETWNRLDHTNPRLILFVAADGDVLALHTEGMALQDSLTAFESIRHSLHFVSVRR